MQITFRELLIKPGEYTGVVAKNAEIEIINRAADLIKMRHVTANASEFADYADIMDEFNNLCDFDVFHDFNWQVDFVQQFVEVPPGSLVQ